MKTLIRHSYFKVVGEEQPLSNKCVVAKRIGHLDGLNF